MAFKKGFAYPASLLKESRTLKPNDTELPASKRGSRMFLGHLIEGGSLFLQSLAKLSMIDFCGAGSGCAGLDIQMLKGVLWGRSGGIFSACPELSGVLVWGRK